MKFESVIAIIEMAQSGEAISADLIERSSLEISQALDFANGEIITQTELETAQALVPETAASRIIQLETELEAAQNAAAGENFIDTNLNNNDKPKTIQLLTISELSELNIFKQY